MATTFEHLRARLIKDYRLTPEVVKMDASLDALGIDSLGVAELIAVQHGRKSLRRQPCFLSV